MSYSNNIVGIYDSHDEIAIVQDIVILTPERPYIITDIIVIPKSRL